MLIAISSPPALFIKFWLRSRLVREQFLLRASAKAFADGSLSSFYRALTNFTKDFSERPEAIATPPMSPIRQLLICNYSTRHPSIILVRYIIELWSVAMLLASSTNVVSLLSCLNARNNLLEPSLCILQSARFNSFNMQFWCFKKSHRWPTPSLPMAFLLRLSS